MKKHNPFALMVAAISVLTFPALAQNQPAPSSDRAEHLAAVRQAERLNAAAKSSELIGMTVRNYQDEKLGKVADLAVDVESGRILQVILSTGGFADMRHTLTAVPPGKLHYDMGHKVLHLDTSKVRLKNAPKFEMSKWSEQSDTKHLTTVYRHYGEEPTLSFIQTGEVDPNAITSTADSPNTITTRNRDGTWSKVRISSESQSMVPMGRLGQAEKASKLIGTPVKNLQDVKLGKVENLLVDLTSGRILAAIISSGGFLRMDDELSAVPPAALHFNKTREILQLDTTKEMLGNAPHFKAKEWPNFAQPEYVGGVYRAYDLEPYFAYDPAARVDNTARNARDRDDRTVTPFDQGNSKADLAVTADIRKEIMSDRRMSLNAKNVKIITIQGQVTLRGPVNTAEEKRLIGEIADRVARSGHVDNQLEIQLGAGGNR